MKGNTNFGPGGIFYDILYVAKNYGLEPDQAYHGSKDRAQTFLIIQKWIMRFAKKWISL